MSTTQHTEEMMAESELKSAQTPEQRFAALEERMSELEAENARLREELEKERELRHELIHVKTPSVEDAGMGAVFVAGHPLGSMVAAVDNAVEGLEDELGNVDDRISEEQQNRGHQDAKLQRRVSALAEKAGVEIHDSDLMGEDKIRRVLKHGAGDVENNPSKASKRAACVLRNIGKWGEQVSDAHGQRIYITGPTIIDRLEDARDESLASSQAKRIMEQIEAWGADSPRKVTTDFSGSPNKLKIEIDTGNNR